MVFTSGKRNAEQQANAMAPNVVKDRKWIEKSTPPARSATATAIAAGLLGIVNAALPSWSAALWDAKMTQHLDTRLR